MSDLWQDEIDYLISCIPEDSVSAIKKIALLTGLRIVVGRSEVSVGFSPSRVGYTASRVTQGRAGSPGPGVGHSKPEEAPGVVSGHDVRPERLSLEDRVRERELRMSGR